MGEAAMLTRPEVRKLRLCVFAGGCPERSAELPQVHTIEVVPLAGLRYGFGARQPSTNLPSCEPAGTIT